MLAILGFVWGKVAGPLAIVLAVLLGVQTVRLGEVRRARDHADRLLASTAADLGVCHGNVAGLNAGLDRQVAAVAVFKATSEAWVTQSAKAAADARAAAQSSRSRADAILAEPRGVGDACALADEMILREAGR